ncbi:MAG: glycosyltransferase family 4 protein [Anaerolineae bacterium]|nr:glycosyltransferase family 4 protein [Anaerolineae bacterium]
MSGLGGTVHDRQILKGLAALGVRVEMPLPKGALYEEVDGWHIHSTPRYLLSYYEYNWLLLPTLYRLWRSPGFDLLRLHSPTIGLAGLLFRQVTGVPVVAHHHHLEDRAIDRVLARLLVSASDKVITGSDFSRRQLVAACGPAVDKIAVVPNGVAEKYRPYREMRSRNRGRPVLFYLGSLKPRKNLRFLLDVFAEVRDKEPDVKLIVGGAGPQRAQLEAYATALGLGNSVAFTGYIPEEKKVEYYNRADIFVLPSRLEGFGMVATEAMACGTPVVVSNVSSLPEIVLDGETGFLADPYRISDFAEKILRLVHDPVLRMQMGINGRDWTLRRFSWDRAATLTRDIYEQVIAERMLG